jgi:hypothetical protein
VKEGLWVPLSCPYTKLADPVASPDIEVPSGGEEEAVVDSSCVGLDQGHGASVSFLFALSIGAEF